MHTSKEREEKKKTCKTQYTRTKGERREKEKGLTHNTHVQKREEKKKKDKTQYTRKKKRKRRG